jgi:hypothetical protein
VLANALAADGEAGSSVGAVNVKATSFVSEYAPLLVEPETAALFLYAAPAITLLQYPCRGKLASGIARAFILSGRTPRTSRHCCSSSIAAIRIVQRFA